jgi:hypothetical protein
MSVYYPKIILTMTNFKLLFALLALLWLAACNKSENNQIDDDDDVTDVLAIYSKIYGATEVYQDGNYVVIKTNGRPDHKSPYYQNTTWSSMYESYQAGGGTNPNWTQNPNKIGSQNYVFRVPLNPTAATNHAATALGPIGISLNGVPFFNQYAGPDNQPLTNEVNSFDQYNGHPDQTSRYHYHFKPLYLLAQEGDEVLLGFLLDGFPVYGPVENGQAVSNNDLDAYHGHTHATEDFPNGIYHYHITDADPYINGSGYYGTPGTFTNN